MLRHIQPGEVPRLIQGWGQLEPAEGGMWRTRRTLVHTVNLQGAVDSLLDLLDDDPDEVLDYLDFWFLQDVPFSKAFLAALSQAARNEFTGFLGPLLAELEWAALQRGDDLTGWQNAWQAGRPPIGYRWRMVYAYQILTNFSAHPPQQALKYREACAIGLALLAQALVDQNDEAALQAVPDEMIRQSTLLNILGSTRPNVLPDIVDQITALGAKIVPHLIEILEDDNVWAWLRALPVLKKIARLHPGAADEAVPAILDLIYLDQSDDVLDQAEKTLKAIGPGAINSIGARLGQDYVYDIYGGGALANIPTEASWEAWLHYLIFKPSLDEYELEMLADLGHPAALVWLRDNFDWGNDPLFCTALYRLAVVTDYPGPELTRWRRVARQDYQAYVQAREREPSKRPSIQQRQQPVKKQKKKKRKQAKAQKRKQQKKKKKKR